MQEHPNTHLEQPVPVEPVDSDGSPPKNSAPSSRLSKFVHHKSVWIELLVIIVLAVGAGAFWVGKNSQKNDASAVKTTAANSALPGSAIANLPKSQVLASNSYFDTPKLLPNLHFFKNFDLFGDSCSGTDSSGQATGCQPSVTDSDVSYYQVGTTSVNQSIDVIVVPNGVGSLTFFALGKADKTYAVLAQMNEDIAGNISLYKNSFSTNVNIDTTSKINDIDFPATVTVNSQSLTSAYQSLSTSNFMENGLGSIRGGFFGDTSTSNISKITDKDGLAYYKVTVKDQPTFQVVEVYGAYKNLFSDLYMPSGEIASTTGKLAVQWTGGENNSSTYFSGGQGCGSAGGYVIAKGLSASQLTAVGKTPKGQTVYQLAASAPLAQAIYNDDYSNGENLADASLQNLTAQQFTDKHAYFLAQNNFGEYVLFQRDDMFIRGGCGKPVIYLYPAKATQVSVKVGAQVKKSLPQYGPRGWENVTAYPDGKLTYNGQTYGSLYWEGYGDGQYPGITKGVVVKTDQADKTVRAQLAAQGLKASEINDFMDFWGPKLQTGKQYTRLTWLGTSDMNRLAPLDINPSPNTLIRVFLDFEGLDKPYTLTPQKFQAPKRQGFTVVEWGGLLRNGISQQ